MNFKILLSLLLSLFLFGCDKQDYVLGGSSHADFIAQDHEQLWMTYQSLHRELREAGFHPFKDHDPTDLAHVRRAYKSDNKYLENCQIIIEFDPEPNSNLQLVVSSYIEAPSEEDAKEKRNYVHSELTKIRGSLKSFNINELE